MPAISLTNLSRPYRVVESGPEFWNNNNATTFSISNGRRTSTSRERSLFHGDTALLLLCRSLQADDDDDDDDFLAYMMSLHLDAGADTNVSRFQGKTCLLEACERNSPTMARLLLGLRAAGRSGLRAHPPVDSAGRRRLAGPVSWNGPTSISILLSNGWKKDGTKPIRRTPLCFSIVHDSFRAAKMLLVAGASPCRHPESTDETPLYMAVKLARTTRNSKSIAQKAELNNNNINNSSSNNENNDDNTGNVDIVELLLQYQSPINTLSHKPNKYAKSPLINTINNTIRPKTL
ncbi:hypothetical protein CTA1_10717 [Colletotrichum tanaceti]|uniref:Uncharacterized protein n=1 Tax=Colletotrichum tanaceti TaxID=1306861 RepID=A0A4U6X5J0_9PEZI|nr:hypothetical protein CTA1_10717 [Colletotrichum tanaceti]